MDAVEASPWTSRDVYSNDFFSTHEIQRLAKRFLNDLERVGSEHRKPTKKSRRTKMCGCGLGSEMGREESQVDKKRLPECDTVPIVLGDCDWPSETTSNVSPLTQDADTKVQEEQKEAEEKDSAEDQTKAEKGEGRW